MAGKTAQGEEIDMKNVTKSFLLVLALAVLIVAAQAQSPAMMKGTIPFDFIVANQTVAAGEYTVKMITLNPEIEAWHGTDGHAFVLRTIPLSALGEGTKLVFHRYGDQYFLAEVWSRGESHQVIANARETSLAATQRFEPVAVLMTSRR